MAYSATRDDLQTMRNNNRENGFRNSTLGWRIGDFGLFASGLLAFSLGLAAFCGSCFVAIVSILAYNSLSTRSSTWHPVDFADSYRYVALPIGIATLLVSALVLAVLWFRRQVKA